MKESSVIQDWVSGLPLMAQGTLMTCIRGNDIQHAPRMKPITRWLRSLLLVNGNPENDFMDVLELPAVEDFEDELEYLTLHYFLHLLHSLEIVGYSHPDQGTREIAFDYYARLCDWMHCFPEPSDEMDERLSGRPGTTGSTRRWVRADPYDSDPRPIRVIEKVVERVIEAPQHRQHGRLGS